jgi:hypothetical protein
MYEHNNKNKLLKESPTIAMRMIALTLGWYRMILAKSVCWVTEYITCSHLFRILWLILYYLHDVNILIL